MLDHLVKTQQQADKLQYLVRGGRLIPTGSRYFGYATPASDYDFMCSPNDLQKIKDTFQELQKVNPGNYKDMALQELYQFQAEFGVVQVQVLKSEAYLRAKRYAQEKIKNALEAGILLEAKLRLGDTTALWNRTIKKAWEHLFPGEKM